MVTARSCILQSLLLAALLAGVAAGPATAATMRAFATSATCTGELGPCTAAAGDSGLAAANNLCQELATAAGLTSNGEIFRAWASDSTADAYCNVLGLAGQRSGSPPCGVVSLPPAGPWQRLDGTPFASSLAQLVTTGPITSLEYFETGSLVPNSSYVHTGTNLDGTYRATHACAEWTNGTGSSNSSGGNTDVVAPSWASGASIGCNTPGRLLCFEVGAGDPLTYPSLPGALAFVTSATGPGDLAAWPSSGGLAGLAGADAICGALASAAHLPSPSSFVAYLSTGATSAVSRLTLDGPWERVDGVPVASSKADLTDGRIANPIAYHEQDGRFQVDAWTGTQENGTATAFHCSGWSSGQALDNGTSGRPWRTENSWTGASAPACTTPLHLFCFSNQVLLGWDSFESGNLGRWPVAEGVAP